MEPGQRILKVHGDSQQVADCLTKITTLNWEFHSCSILPYNDGEVQNIVAHQNTESDSITHTITFPINMLVKFGKTCQHDVFKTLKSGDETDLLEGNVRNI